MAVPKQSAQEFIQDCFSPMIAVVSSTDADSLCLKNNLSFVELLQPFCRLTAEAFIRDPLSNSNYAVKNLRLVIKEMSQFPPQSTLAKKILNEVVSSCSTQSYDNTSNTIKYNDSDEIQIHGSTPWYETYRSCFLEVSYPSDHEFTKNYISCIFVVSSCHPDPLDQFNKLGQQQNQQQQQAPSKLPKWFSSNIFKYYVLVHDYGDGDIGKAEKVFQSMKTQYGAHACHLLQINSRSSESPQLSSDVSVNSFSAEFVAMPDPWSQFLNKKPIKLDSKNYDSGSRTPLEDSSYQVFPGHVTEGGVVTNSASSPEEGVEIIEVLAPSSSTSSLSEEHPLSMLNHINQVNNSKILKIESVDEKDSPLGSNFSENSNGYPPKWPLNKDTLISQTVPQSSQHGACLSASDIDRVRIFIHEYCVRGLFPYAERLIRTLNEQVSNRKGLHKSLFSATKKWFAGNKSGVQNLSVPSNSVIYSQEALELQVRRLGDLAFMFQNYELAYQSYYTAKRDFNGDQAWFYYAGALEMAGLSVFMQGANSQRQYPQHYLESAISTYISCKVPHFATRATIFSTECLKDRGMYSEAAMQYIRMTSEDSDLRSALLLEQAAHCFILRNKPNPMVRKYAFHMILAGHRFSKAGQRRHSLRCYRQAFQVYRNKGWTLAEDHINFTIGRQSFNLKEYDKACLVFKNLLFDGSKQSAAQQAAFLREYLFVYKELNPNGNFDADDDCDELRYLPLPKLVSPSTKILLGSAGSVCNDDGSITASSVSFDDDKEDNVAWQQLEKMVVMAHNKILPKPYRPTLQCLTCKTDNSVKPRSVVNEVINVELEIKNTLKIPLSLTNIRLLWTFKAKGDDGEFSEDILNNSNGSYKMSVADEIIEGSLIPELRLECLQSHKIHPSLVPKVVGELQIIGINYSLSSVHATSHDELVQSSPVQKLNSSSSVTITGRLCLSVEGPRLNNAKAEKCGRIYGQDHRLEISVVEPMPLLQALFYGSPKTMLCGEVKQLMVEFKNVGERPLQSLYVSSDTPQMFSFGALDSQWQMDYGVYKASPVPTPRKHSNKLERLVSTQPVLIEDDEISRVCQINLGTDCDTLETNSSIRVPLWICASQTSGLQELKLLFYYHLVDEKNKYRVLRHRFVFTVVNSIDLQAWASRNNSTCKRSPSTNGGQTTANSLHVGLEVENTNESSDSNSTEVTVIQVSSVSSNWSLLPISYVIRDGIKVCPGEKAHFSFKAISFESQENSDQSDKKVLVFSNIPFSESEIDSCSSPCLDFYHRSKFIAIDLSTPDATSSTKVERLRNARKVVEKKSMESALDADITIIVLWKALIVDGNGQSHLVMGQHHLPIKQIDATITTASSKEVVEDKLPLKIILSPEERKMREIVSVDLPVTSQLVKYNLIHPHRAKHRFSENRVCIVPVSMVLHNCSKVSAFVKIVAVVAPRNKTHESGTDTLSTQFSWVRRNNTRFELTPGQTKDLELTACFTSPGTYNLSAIHIKVKPLRLTSNLQIKFDDDGFVVQSAVHSPVIVIEDES